MTIRLISRCKIGAKMKIAFISDIHFGVRGSNPFFLEQYDRYFEEQFFPYLRSNQISDVFILGDFWESRKALTVPALNQALKFLNRLAEENIRVKILYGNHDVFYKNTNTLNSIDWIGRYPNIEICEETLEFEVDGCRFAMVSWICADNRERIENFIKNTDATILLGHFEIQKFEMLKGIYCEIGYQSKDFAKFKKVFSGHFHVHSSDGRVVYLGNPFQTQWGDLGVKKGFVVFDTTTSDYEFVENTKTLYNEIVYDPSDPPNPSVYSQQIVRLILPETYDIHALNQYTESISKMTQSLEFRDNAPDVTEYDLDEDLTLIELIDQCLGTVKNVQDPEVLKERFIAIYQEALEKLKI